MQQYKYLSLVTGLFATLLIVSNLASTRIIEVGWFTFDAGTLMFPLTYIFNDLLTEVYGYKVSRRVIWTGFLALIIAAVSFWVVSLFPSPPQWPYSDDWHNIMGVVPRLVLASLVAYFSGEFINSYVLAKLKVKTQGRYLGLRLIGSTAAGQIFDTLMFMVIAFWGVLEGGLWGDVALSNYLFKVGVEIVLLPLTYVLIKFFKKNEGVDVFDHRTNFNPFKWNIDEEEKGAGDQKTD